MTHDTKEYWQGKRAGLSEACDRILDMLDKGETGHNALVELRLDLQMCAARCTLQAQKCEETEA